MQRVESSAPSRLWWDQSTPIRYTELSGGRLRYIQTGQGPNLLLLHTLRTHLDIFHKVIPALSQTYTVHALDYPGHGYSDIPETEYTPKYFADSVAAFLRDRGIQDTIVAGVSIGGSIGLMLAGRRIPEISRVVAINPLDYLGGGVGRGNVVALAVFTMLKLPMFGRIALLLNNPKIERKLLEGGVTDPSRMLTEFSDQVFSIGLRPGYSTAFLNLVKHVNEWNDIKSIYNDIEIPVQLVYGSNDWATESERAKSASLIPDVRVENVEDGGHFLVLDQPEAVIRIIESQST